jgi:xylan 1,4-beta-xylosidase
VNRRNFLLAGSASLAGSFASAASRRNPYSGRELALEIDPQRAVAPLPHYWENIIGADRLAIAFRERWLQELVKARELCGFNSVRCHGLFDDEMGICAGAGPDGPITSFVYLDQVYDRLLDMGVRPYVELSFMPTAMASSRNAVFWYRGNTSPPANMDHWAQLVDALARHLVKRYGIDEVTRWRFECWNEPNLSFWAGTREQYLELYRRTALAIKAVDGRLTVGGPATAQMSWIPELLQYCKAGRVPIDFVSSHVYADDPQENVFGVANRYPIEQVIPMALRQAHDQMSAAGYHDLPLIVSEWSSQNPAFIAHTLKECRGLAESMSFWQVSSVFEEQGPPRAFPTSIYGLFLQNSIPRASLHAFTLLHRLGEQQTWAGEGPVLASQRRDGTSAVLIWNLIPPRINGNAGNPAALPEERLETGESRRITLKLKGAVPTAAQVTLLDPARSSAEAAYDAIGRPEYPSREELEELRQRSALPPPKAVTVQNGELAIDLPANAIALLEFAS